MSIDFEDIVDAYELASFGGGFGTEAYLCKRTGRVYYQSDFSDEVDELPDDIDDSEKYVALPSKSELHLGRNLAIEFTYQESPQHIDKVQGIFSKKGAYSRFKDLLGREGLLDKWYEFESKARDQALRKWCQSESIEING